MEVLTAALQLDISSFSQALQTAGAQIAQFAQEVTQKLQSATTSLSGNTQGAQANQQASNQLAAAYLALAQSITQQTQTYGQAQAASLAYRQEQDKAREAARQAAQEARAAAQASTAWTTAMGVVAGLGIATSLHAIVGELKQFVVESVNVAVKLQALQISFTAITGSALTGARTLLELRQMANTLGVDFLSLATNFRNFQAAAQGTKLTTQDLKTLFLGASEAARTFGLSSEQTQRLFMALDRMMQTGTINARELRLQFGQALPGGLEIFAKSIGVTVQELFEMTKRGELLAEDVLPKLGRALHDEFGEKAKAAAESAQATFARFANNMLDVSRTVGNAILTILTPVLNTINKAFDAIKKLKDEAAQHINQGIGTTPTTPLPPIEGRDLEGELDRARQALADERAMLQKMNAVSSVTGLVGLPFDASIANQVKMVKSLEAAYESLLKKRDTFLAQQKEGSIEGVSPDAIPFKKQIDATNASIKDLDQTIATGAAIRKNFPSTIVGKEDELEAARKKLQDIDKTITDIGADIGKSGGLQQGLPAPMQKTVDALNAQRKAAAAVVNTLEDQIDAQRKADQEADAARKKALRDMAKDAEERKVLTEQMTLDAMRVTQGEFEFKRAALEKELDYARAKGVDETTLAAFESARRRVIAQEEGEALAKVHDQILAQEREDARIQQTINDGITRLKAQGTKSQLDDLKDSLGKQRREYEALSATVEQLAEFDAAATARLMRAKTEEVQKELDKQRHAWNALGQQIQQTLSSAFEQILSSTFDLWDSIKRGFIKLLADLAAAALAQQIIIPFMMQQMGSGGLAGAFAGGGALGGDLYPAGTTGADVTSGKVAANGGFGVGSAVSMIGSGASIYGGLTGQSVLGATGILGGVLATPIGSIGAAYPGEATGISSAMDAMGLEATTIGEAAGAAGVGIAAGSIFAKLNAMMGLHGTANATLAGAGGGAIAGTMILPGIGTAIGAAIGALGGFIAGILGRGPDPHPAFQPTQVQAGLVAFDPAFGLQATQDFKITEEKHKDVGQLADWTKTFDAINASLQDMAGQVVSQFQSVSPELQQALVIPINQAFADIASKVSQLHIAGDDMEGFVKNMQEMMGTTLPGFFTDAMHGALAKLETGMKRLNPVLTSFTTILDTIHKDIQDTDTAIAQKVADVTSAFSQRMTDVFNAVEQSMESLRQQQVQLNATFKAASTALMTELYSPAQAFLFAQQQYADLKQQFTGSTQEQQLTIAPQLAQAAQQLLSMAKSSDVLGQDPETVRRLQASLIQDLAGFQGSTEMAFSDIHNALVDFRQTNLDALSVSRESTLNALEAFRVSQDAALQQQADLASGQITALTGALANPDSIDSVITSSLGVLQLIQQALPGIMGTSTAEIMAQSQVVLLGGLTTIATSQLQVLQDISTKLGAGVPHFAEGSGTLPRPTFAMLHAGERVLSARENFGGGTTRIEHVIRAEGDTPGGQAVVEQVADAVIARIVHGASRLGTIPLVVRR